MMKGTSQYIIFFLVALQIQTASGLRIASFENQRDADFNTASFNVTEWQKAWNARLDSFDASGPSPKNVLLVVLDDTRASRDCSPTTTTEGARSKPFTPNICEFQKRALTLERVQSSYPWCCPSRASLLSGRQSQTTGVWANGGGPSSGWRPNGGNFTSIPQFFQQRGYYTMGIGKIGHNADGENELEVANLSAPILGLASSGTVTSGRGWTEFDRLADWQVEGPINDYLQEGETVVSDYTKCHIPAKQANLFMAVQEEKEMCDTMKKIKAVQALEKLSQPSFAQKDGKTQPFFLTVGFEKPHTPFTFPKEFLDLYPEVSVPHNVDEAASDLEGFSENEVWQHQDIGAYLYGKDEEPWNHTTINHTLVKNIRKHYFAAASYTDHNFGEVLKALKKTGLDKNTIVVLVGDHGFMLGEHGTFAKHKLLEESLHVPMMFHVPGLTEEAIQYHGPADSTDLFPTLVELAFGSTDGLPSCPKDSKGVDTCTDGTSFASIAHKPDAKLEKPLKDGSLSMTFHRDRKTGGQLWLGFSTVTHLKTDHEYRYTAYLHCKNDKTTWSEIVAEEMYNHTSDASEDVNIAAHNPDLVSKAKALMQAKSPTELRCKV